MIHAMVGRSMAAAGMLVIAGCAQDGAPHPAYLGLSDLAAGSTATAAQTRASNEEPEVFRHIQSNKVLGAMAFQKVTGQAVDPDSLLGHGSE